jgi:hypothetical protein
MEAVDHFLAEAARRGLEMPGLFGVFYYRSGSPKTLERLNRFIPVPIEGLHKEFDEGRSADDICALTLGALAERGVDKVYISNLQPLGAEQRVGALERLARG